MDADPRYSIDDVKFAYDLAGQQYVPLNNCLEVKFTKDTNRKIFPGTEADHANSNNSTFSHGTGNAFGNAGGQLVDNLNNLDKLKTKF